MDGAAALAVILLAVLLAWWLAWRLVRITIRMSRRVPLRLQRSRVWARTHPVRAVLAERHPRTYAFIAGRFATDRFAGLPLTLMVAASVYLAGLLGGLVEEVVEAKGVVGLDVAADALLTPYRDTVLVDVFIWITRLGDNTTLIAVTLVATGFLWADRRSSLILPLWVAIAGANATTWIGKFGFDRERPDFITTVTAASPAFPSAHATGALAVYGFVAYAIARDLRTPRERFEVTFWTVVLVSAIGFSRIFVSVHHASDVAAGFLVGGFWLLVGFAIAEHWRGR